MPMRLLYFVPRPEGVKDDQAIPILFDWRPQGNYLASSNGTISVRISDRYGEIFDDFNAPEKDKFLQWHKDGDYLAAIGSNSPQVTMYTVSIKEANEIDLGLATKEVPTFCLWSETSPVLVVGTNRGNVFFLNVLTSRKTPVMGKHQRAITSGAFNDKGLLALGSEDATITISNAQGDTVNSFGCNAEPEDVHYVKIFDEYDKNLDEYFITAILSKKTLMVASALGSDPPVNLQFQDKYGNIKKCCWYEKGHVLMAFETGTIVCLRLDRVPDKSQEMFSVKDFESYLSDISLCLEARMAIVIGDNCIKVRHLDRLSELTSLVTVEDDQKGLDKVKANNNGSLLAVTGKSGTMMIFLTKIPIIGSAYRDKIVYLSSLNKVKIHFDGDRDSIEIDVRVESSHLSVSDYHIAVVTNNRAWFYELHTKSVSMVNEYEYLSTVTKLKMNQTFVMALLDGRAQIHKIVGSHADDDSEGEQMSFPFQTDNVEYSSIVDGDLTERFFIYCTESNHITFFSLQDWSLILDFRHNCGITKIVAEFTGIRLAFFDERHECHIFCPATYKSVVVPTTGSNYIDCLWENFTIDRDTFTVSNGQSLTVFILNKDNEGINVLKIGETAIPYGHMPMMLSKGIIYCMTQGGKINTFILESQKTEANYESKSLNQLIEALKQQLILRRWRNAWKICEQGNNTTLWNTFAEEALEAHMFSLASRIYKHIGNVAMAWTVEDLEDKEDYMLVKGMIAMIKGKYDEAEEAFVESGNGEMALEVFS